MNMRKIALLVLIQCFCFGNVFADGVAESDVSDSKPAQVLKVLTFNFNSETAREKNFEALAGLRLKSMVEWIKKNDPDIILMQEGWNYKGTPSVITLLAEATGYDSIYNLGMGAPKYFYDSSGILAKKKFQMNGQKDVLLPHSGYHIGNRRSWIVIAGRVSYAVGTRLTLDNGEPLYVYTTHLIGADENARGEQLLAVHEAMKKHVEEDGGDFENAHVIFGGDLNLNPTTAGIQSFQQQGYADTWSLAHPGDDSCTFCGTPKGPYFNPFIIGAGQVPDQRADYVFDERVDYIFNKSPKMQTLGSTLQFTAPLNQVWMSDHYGVMSLIGVNGLMPLNTPNSLRDYEGVLADTELLELNDAHFSCSNLIRPCFLILPQRDIDGPKGFTVINESRYKASIRISGPGYVFTSSEASLKKNTAAAFTFDAIGDYDYSIKNYYGSEVRGRLHVNQFH
jgi:exonuclease III